MHISQKNKNIPLFHQLKSLSFLRFQSTIGGGDKWSILDLDPLVTYCRSHFSVRSHVEACQCEIVSTYVR